MLKIYHNSRCTKSREGLEILKNSGKEFEIKEYLKEPLEESELESLVKKLKITPMQLVRKNEKIWKEEYKNRDLSDREIITAMVKNPKLIERPIVETEKEAVIGRPPSDIEKLL
ncbi:arsenate reductase (glutaredoxin) [Christiangramia forsetii]|uniref:Arsenate reductase n=2 Tax=Christiangramia forsetii TaxID=411153 RepID=A0M2C8_CHRFK|nr:arsenate reductase (glutaredoxin) [Christiangramia forsetii]GGG39472.1 arsenate reductase (glutaredoxin) [Christiangramia forsetii]CAL66773.1 arsenate reductase [Christiangramia forsetii KT0803]